MGRLIELEKHGNDKEEVAGVFLENRKAREEIQRRINPYELKFDGAGQPNFKYETETEMGKAEYKGMRSMWELAKEGYRYIFWISPPGGRSVYVEGRLVVAKVVDGSTPTMAGRRGSTRTEIELECRGIPVLESAERMMEMANEILDRGGGIVDGIRKPEDLREQAIGINLKSDLWNFCEEIFGMSKVWEAIRQGEDVKRKMEVTEMVERATGEIGARFGKINTENSIIAGAMLERMMARWGYAIMGGNHGGTNVAAMGGAFNYMFNEGKMTRVLPNGEKLSYCEKCRYWYKGDKCPYCNRNN